MYPEGLMRRIHKIGISTNIGIGKRKRENGGRNDKISEREGRVEGLDY